jgi:hypothetical protein
MSGARLEAAIRQAMESRVRVQHQWELVAMLKAHGYCHMLPQAEALLSMMLETQRLTVDYLPFLD